MPGKRPRLISRSPSIARLYEQQQQQPLKQCHAPAVAPDTTEDPAWHSSQMNHFRCGCIPPVDFLDSCFFCRRPLGQGLDIFMYRGDRAFCSVECRHHQIVLDERRENFRRIALKKAAPTPSSRLPNENGRKVAQSGTTSAA